MPRSASTIPPTRRADRPRLLPDQAGFSLIELLVAMSMFAVILLAIFGLLDTATKAANDEQERGISLTEESAAVANMAQILREAYEVNGPTVTNGSSSDWMDVDVRLVLSGGGQAEYRVLFVCNVADPSTGYDECLKYQQPVPVASFTAGSIPSGVTGVPVIRYVINETKADPSDPVFQDLTDPSASGSRPTYGQILVRTPGAGQLTQSYYTHQVVLNSAFYMRNLDFGN